MEKSKGTQVVVTFVIGKNPCSLVHVAMLYGYILLGKLNG